MEYRIIGSDLREYGPVDVEEIREWINEGRADANTLVCEIDEKQWIRLRDLPMVAGDLPNSAPKITGGMSKTGDGTIQISYLFPRSSAPFSAVCRLESPELCSQHRQTRRLNRAT